MKIERIKPYENEAKTAHEAASEFASSHKEKQDDEKIDLNIENWIHFKTDDIAQK